MPTYKPYTVHQLAVARSAIEDAVYTVIAPLAMRAWCTREPVPFQERCSGSEHTFSVGDKWGDLFDSAWFHFTGTVPHSAAGSHVVLLLDVNGEMAVFDPAGVPVRGLTNVSSGYDFSLGAPGKRVLQLTPCAAGGEPIDVWADAGCNDLFGNLQGNGTVKQADIALCNDQVRALYYDFEVLLDFLHVLPEDSPRYQQILTGLGDVARLLYQGVAQSAPEARALLRPLLAQRGGDPALHISAIGHAHMDLGWLWPIRETIRKGARTFSTALDLMASYPDYVFGASQAQYFLWMKEHYPALYAKIKDKVREGRIEPQGAMWVEADTNITGGESLVRQLLQGKRFFKQEFGVDIRYLWLPDVFGYTAALPQLLRKAGVTYFSTQKLSWSLINSFPHQSFHWQGLDGTAILTHMLPEETYNSPAAPRSVRKIERNYKDSGVSSYALMVFGIGDGGGGPGEEHLERLERVKNLAGLSPVTQESTESFFAKWQQQAARFATWVGELYLERHEGTLTTEARNKWYNRKMELALRDVEWSSVVAHLLDGTPYPTDRLQTIWREVLLYQFHDILPGSSIKRVYDESLARYRDLHTELVTRLAENDARLVASVDTSALTNPVVVINTLSWPRAEWVRAGDRWVYLTVPAMGYVAAAVPDAAPLPSLAASDRLLENDLLRVEFGPDGALTRVLDKRCDRELLPEGAAANRFAVYRDLGDAWDFAMDYAEQQPRYMELQTAASSVDGPRAVLRQVYHLGHSVLTQEIVLLAGSPRLDFVTHLHWREPEAMLRTRFPVAVHADEASCEIQFGHLRRPTHRNTTWDLARDEVAAHKWVDLSEGDYGVALLNDSKYGHKVKDGAIDLNLLRSVPYPGPRLVADADVAPGEPHHAFTDQADHSFTYALFPHPGDVAAGGVVAEAYALNVPLRCLLTDAHPGSRPPTASFLSLDTPDVVIESVKQAEGSPAVIVRLYEAGHRRVRARLQFGFPVAAVIEADLMENDLAVLDLDAASVALDFAPFEIKTLKLALP